MPAAGPALGTAMAPPGQRSVPGRRAKGTVSVPVWAEPQVAAVACPPPLATASNVAATAAQPKKRGRQAGQKLGVQAQPELLEQSRLRDRTLSAVTKPFSFDGQPDYFHKSGWRGEAAVAREAQAAEAMQVTTLAMDDESLTVCCVSRRSGCCPTRSPQRNISSHNTQCAHHIQSRLRIYCCRGLARLGLRTSQHFHLTVSVSRSRARCC
jgi:hypothetical protein